MRKNFEKAVLCGLVALGLAACSGKAEVSTKQPEPEPEPAAEPEAGPVEMAVVDPSDVHIEGDHLTIDKKIMFATDSDEILPESNEILDHIAEALKNHTELSTVHVIGHTDASGGHDHNQDLSERRAAAVVSALTARGVTQQIDSKGVGETEPTCEEDTDECHEANRRVEFVVLADAAQ